MLSIVQTLIEGSGTVSKNVAVDSKVMFTASGVTNVESYLWYLISIPKNSEAYLETSALQSTKLANMDKVGNYLVRLIINKDLQTQQIQTASTSVPGVISPQPTPSQPQFDTGGRVRNFSFRLPGGLPGYAEDWAVVDEENVLSSNGGITGGRITPTNFTTDDDQWAFCLGDDIGANIAFDVNGEFSISQNVDFRNVDTLNIDLKFIKR